MELVHFIFSTSNLAEIGLAFTLYALKKHSVKPQLQSETITSHYHDLTTLHSTISSLSIETSKPSNSKPDNIYFLQDYQIRITFNIRISNRLNASVINGSLITASAIIGPIYVGPIKTLLIQT